MKAKLLITTLMLFCFASGLLAQKTKIKSLTNSDFRKMNKVELKQNGSIMFANSRLYQVSEDSMLVAVAHWNGDYYTNDHSVFNLNMDHIDQVLVRNKKKSTLYSLVGGIALGTASYFVAKKAFYREKDRLSLTMMGMVGQQYESAIWEPFVAGTLGSGMGVILGTSLAETKIYPNKDKKYAYWKLKTMSYKKRRK